MAQRLWEASDELKRNANITAFLDAVNQRHGLTLSTYPELHRWSIEHIPDFWAMVWDHAGVIASKPYDRVVDDPYHMPGAKWFEGARMNFAQNLLRRRDDHIALVFRAEDQVVQSITYAGLYAMVAGLAKSLRAMGVKPGDRVVGYMPNMIETTAAMLAATAIGVTWASCATDIGPDAAADRLGQVEPVVLFSVDEYLYRGKRFDVVPRAAALAARIPSLRKVVVCSYTGASTPDVKQVPNAVVWTDFTTPERTGDIAFEQMPAQHPV